MGQKGINVIYERNTVDIKLESFIGKHEYGHVVLI